MSEMNAPPSRVEGKVFGRSILGTTGKVFGGIIVFGIMVQPLMRALRTHRRLVVGADCLQLVEHLSGEDVVRLQIPYANVLKVTSSLIENRRRLAIELASDDAPGMYVPSLLFWNTVYRNDRQLIVSEPFRGGPLAISRAINGAMASWRRS